MFSMELGPLPLETLLRMFETGQLASDDVVRRGACGPWQAIEQVAEFSVFFKEAKSPEASTRAEPRSNTIELQDEWHYQLDRRTHGPFPLRALLELVGASGDTASDVLVRRGNDGPWTPFHSLAGTSRSGPAIQSSPTCSTAVMGSRQPSSVADAQLSNTSWNHR